MVQKQIYQKGELYFLHNSLQELIGSPTIQSFNVTQIMYVRFESLRGNLSNDYHNLFRIHSRFRGQCYFCEGIGHVLNSERKKEL